MERRIKRLLVTDEFLELLGGLEWLTEGLPADAEVVEWRWDEAHERHELWICSPLYPVVPEDEIPPLMPDPLRDPCREGARREP